MAQIKWILLAGIALLLLPMAAAFLFPPRVITPMPEPHSVSPKIVYRLPPTEPNDLTGVPIRTQGDSVSLRADTGLDTPGLSLPCFIAALKTYSQARYIRASWSMLIFMNGTDTTVLYDRRKHSVAFYSRGAGDLGSYQSHLLFTGVPESAFTKLADAHREDSEERPSGFFNDLADYGYQQQVLGSWEKAPKN